MLDSAGCGSYEQTAVSGASLPCAVKQPPAAAVVVFNPHARGENQADRELTKIISKL